MSPPAPAPDRRWLVCYFPAAWLGHVCQGLATGVLGPSQVSSIIIMVSLSPVPTPYAAVPGPGAGPARERPPDQPGVDSAGGGQLPGHSSHRGRVQVGDDRSGYGDLAPSHLVSRSRVRAQHTKMVFLSLSVLLVGLFMALLPWAPSFTLLLLGSLIGFMLKV